jgi:hypothetical protein
MLNVLGMGFPLEWAIVGFGFQVDLGENRAQQLLAVHNSLGLIMAGMGIFPFHCPPHMSMLKHKSFQ